MNRSFKDMFDILFDVFAALFTFYETKCATLSGACWTTSPAHWSKSPCLLVTLRIAEQEFLILILLTCKRMSHSTSFSLLVACETKIPHAWRALSVAHAAAEGIVTFLALWIVHEAPLLRVWLLR